MATGKFFAKKNRSIKGLFVFDETNLQGDRHLITFAFLFISFLKITTNCLHQR